MSPRKMFSKLAQLLRRPSSLFQAAQPAARVPAVLQLESGLKLDLTQPLTLGPTPVSTLDVIARDYEMSASHIEIIPGATPGMQVLAVHDVTPQIRFANLGVVGSHMWQEAESRAILENCFADMGVRLAKPMERLSYNDMMTIQDEAEKMSKNSGPKGKPAP